MTAGTTAGNIHGNRISLSRASLSAVVFGALLAGSVLGAATYAAFGLGRLEPAGRAASLAPASAIIRDAQIAVGNGELVGDTRGAAITHIATSASSAGDDGVGPTAAGAHAPGRGPLP
jgi:hypothetical protein